MLLASTLEALARFLTPADARRLQDYLPNALPLEVGGPRYREAVEVFEHVTSVEHVTLAHAREEVFAACQALARLLGPDGTRWLKARIPDELAEWLKPREQAPPPARPLHDAPSRRTLSSGRPGYTRPIAEAAPVPHADTVAEENPHGERKLSSGHPGAPPEE